MDDEPRKLDFDQPEEVEHKAAVEKYDIDFVSDLLDAIEDLGDDGDEWMSFGKKVARIHPEVFMEAYSAVQRENTSYKTTLSSTNDGDAPF